MNNRFELIYPNGDVAMAIADELASDCADVILNWIRAGYPVVCAREPAKDPAPAAQPKRKHAHRATKPAGVFPVGARAYLKWSALDADQRVHLSQYRTEPGEITGMHRNYRTVRFNGDPSVALAITQISNVVEVS